MRKVVLFALLGVAALCHAQPVPLLPSSRPILKLPNYGFSPGEVPARVSSTIRASDGQGITGVLERDLAGQPVIAVEAFWPYLASDTVTVRPSEKLLSRVQDVADAFSTPEQQCVPYAVRGAWVLAPGTRETFNTDFSKYTAMDVSGRPRLLRQLLVSLTPREIDFLSSPNGLAVSGLDKHRQAMATRALRPPFRLVSYRLSAQYPGQREEVAEAGSLITTQPDLSRMRIRAELRSGAPCILVTRRESSGYEHTNAHEVGQIPRPARREIGSDRADTGFSDSGTDLPAISTVPNTFKPSDLDGKVLAQPFGAHGAMTMEITLKRLEAVTGRKFRASMQYAAFRVFVGADTVTCGEVADGLRLALTATWRKVGDIFLLTWDRQGIGALQTLALENAQDLTHASDKAVGDVYRSDSWLDLAMRIPFAKDDPLAWTAGQRALLFGPYVKNANGGEGTTYLHWPQMTPTQQSAVRSLTAGRKIGMPDATGQWVDREITDQDLKNTALQGRTTIDLLVDLGDGAWLALGDWWQQQLDQGQLESLRNQRKYRLEEEKRKAEEARNPRPILQMSPYRQPDRSLAPARQRALMVSVMSSQALATLGTRMSARGFNLLFYPILSGGYTTFPSKAFPPLPDMGTTNGWLACVTAMKGTGIEVVGYMETLAWRKPGVKEHWLDKHPDWLDIDVLGRPLSEYEKATAARLQQPMPAIIGDLLRATEPEVTRRLQTLVTEFATQVGASGLCLDAWSYETAVRFGNQYGGWGYNRAENPLGCAVPDRVASILKYGVDPVDVRTSYGYAFRTPAMAVAFYPSSYRPGGTPAVTSPYVALASSLLPKAKPGGGAWTTYAITNTSRNSMGSDGRPGAPAGPTASVLLSPALQSYPNNAARSLILRVPSADERAAAAKANRPGPTMAILAAEDESMRFSYGQPPDLVVYDFRGAPEEIEDSLRRVGLPEDVKEAPEPNKSVRLSM